MVSIITKYLLTIRESFFLLHHFIDSVFYILGTIINKWFDKQLEILSYRYKQLFFTAAFFHVIFKIIIKFILGFDFILIDNIILFVLLYIIAHILDLYQYIYEIIGSIGKYFFSPITSIYEYEALSMSWTSIFDPTMLKFKPNYIVDDYDRYFFGFFFFFPFFILRYFILREPLLFGVINMLFIISYLIDYNIILTYIYIIILHISRFMFYLSDERYSYKKYNEIWLEYTQIYTSCFYDYMVYARTYKKNTIFKLTFYNLRLAILISNRHFIGDLSTTNMETRARRKRIRDINPGLFFKMDPEMFRNSTLFELFLNMGHSQIEDEILFKHAHRFVFTNRFFWLAILIIVIYFDFYLLLFVIVLVSTVLCILGLIIQQLIINLCILFLIVIIKDVFFTRQIKKQ